MQHNRRQNVNGVVLSMTLLLTTVATTVGLRQFRGGADRPSPGRAPSQPGAARDRQGRAAACGSEPRTEGKPSLPDRRAAKNDQDPIVRTLKP